MRVLWLNSKQSFTVVNIESFNLFYHENLAAYYSFAVMELSNAFKIT